MKVRYLLTSLQTLAINSLAHIDGSIVTFEVNDRRLVEYDVTEKQKCMLDTLLNQKGLVIKDKPQWPSQGDAYYYIDNDGDILKGHWDVINGDPSRIDAHRRDIGNIFETALDAKFEKERLKILNQLKNLSDDDQEWNKVNLHFHIMYTLHFDKIEVWNSSCVKSPYEYYFKSMESAEAAIKIIGEDKLKKYAFNVKEKEN